MAPRRFPIRFTGLNRALSIIGIPRERSWVEIDEERLRVRMGWAFRLDVPRVQVRSAQPENRRVWSWGVHGWRGRWLVNGSSTGIVRIELSPPGRARALPWPFPVSVRELRVSVEDPHDLVAALGG